MSNLLKSKFLLGALVVTAMFAVVGFSKPTPAAADCSITTTLRVGSTGTQVVCLQTALGGLTADGSFGPMTKAAVVAWQAKEGLVADGVFGPKSNAVWAANQGNVAAFPSGCNSASGFSTTTGLACYAASANIFAPTGCTSAAGFSPVTGGACYAVSAGPGPTGFTPAGCTSAAGFSPVTGGACQSLNLPAGCTSTAGFSPTTGGSCSGGGSSSTSGPLAGGAGDVIITETSTDVEDTALEGQATQVLGFKAEASDSDVAITNVKVTLENTDAPTTSYRLSNYVDSVDIYMGSTKVGSADAADFSKSGYVYTKSIALTDAIVREGASHKATFYVVLNAASNIDSIDMAGATWSVTASNIRFQDATGVIMTNGDTDPAVTGLQFSDLATSGDVKLTISKGSGSPVARNVEVSTTSSTPDNLMLEFKLKAAGSDLSFDQLTFTLTGVVAGGANTLATMVTDMSLLNGSDTLSTDPVISAADIGTAVFTLDDTFTIPADTTEPFKVYAKIAEVGATTLTTGDSLLVSLAKTGIATEDTNGDVVTGSNEIGSATGTIQTFSTTSAEVSSMHWTNNTTGTILDFFFTVNAVNDDFDVLGAEVLDSLAGNSIVAAGSGVKTTAGTTKGVITKYSGDTVAALAANAGFTVSAGDTTTFRVRYTVTATSANNGEWTEATITSVAGQAVPEANQTSPTATVNL